MDRRTALGVITTGLLSGCITSAQDDTDPDPEEETQTDQTDEQDSSDPYAALDVAEEIVSDQWLIEAEMYEYDQTRVYDQDSEELIDVAPEQDRFAEVWLRLTNLDDQQRELWDPELLESLDLLVDQSSYSPIEGLPGGYSFDEQQADRELMDDPATRARVRAESRTLIIRVYDIPTGSVVVDTSVIEGVDAVLSPEIY